MLTVDRARDRSCKAPAIRRAGRAADRPKSMVGSWRDMRASPASRRKSQIPRQTSGRIGDLARTGRGTLGILRWHHCGSKNRLRPSRQPATTPRQGERERSQCRRSALASATQRGSPPPPSPRTAAASEKSPGRQDRYQDGQTHQDEAACHRIAGQPRGLRLAARQLPDDHRGK